MLSSSEFITSLELGLIYGLTAIGIYLTFRVLDFPDLTCDGSFTLGAATSASLIDLNFDPTLSLLIAILAGALAGTLTGILNQFLKVTDLLAGILVAFMLYSVNLKVMGGLPNLGLLGLEAMDSLTTLTLIVSSVIGILLVLFMTDFGLALRSVGQNKILAKLYGVRISLMTILGLALSNGLISFSGAIFAQNQGFADVSQGIGTVIIGLASVMIGETLTYSEKLWIRIIFCVVGSIIYRLLIATALHSEFLGLETQDLNLITGLLIVAVILLRRRRTCFA